MDVPGILEQKPIFVELQDDGGSCIDIFSEEYMRLPIHALRFY